MEGLDPEQRAAVGVDGGPVLLVAGAGSGKTRAIVARIARLLRDGVPPGRIVGITFTNRAAEEMRERVAGLIGRPSPDSRPRRPDLPWLGTFHAFGAGLLRRFGPRIGLSPGFSIFDARDRADLVRQILRQRNLDEKKFPAARFVAWIERTKREDRFPGAEAPVGFFAEQAEEVRRAYDEALRSAGAVDFSDLIRLPLRLFREHPEVLETVRGEIRHLLVDEYQDVDAGQAALCRMIGRGADSLLAVGDEDQSIYGWRGGSAGPMLSFERDFPGGRVLYLRTNYRSRRAILDAAGALIRKNRSRRDKEIVASRTGGDPPLVRSFADSGEEADGAVREISDRIAQGVPPSSIAVFYRVNAQSRPFEDALRRAGLPYRLRGALSFYDRAAVRDALSHLRWFLHPDDPVAFSRLVRAPRRGVGEATLARLREAARSTGTSFAAQLSTIPRLAGLLESRRGWERDLPGRSAEEALRDALVRSGYLDWIERGTGPEPDGAGKEREERREHLEELLRLAGETPGTGEGAVRAFLEQVSLAPREEGEGEADGVCLMTIHTAKGLEFDTVFLAGLEEGLLPHSRSVESEDEVEEERRLLYVGMTRAREMAFLSYARRRSLFGGFREQRPSRFLAEIPRSLLSWRDSVTVSGSPAPRPAAIRPAQREPSEPKPVRVRHPAFGEGIVEAVEGSGDDRKITARFSGFGRKKILVRAVRMEIFYGPGGGSAA
ncbi:MAG: UvrD-helicase domain-containing protein [Deltaproteobacteria bacterium]